MSRLTPLKLYALALLSSVCAWAAALSLQYGMGLEPCSLCILQRWALSAVLVGAALGTALEYWGRGRWAAFLVLTPACVGMVVAAKHLLLQIGPRAPEVGCGFGGLALLDNLPLSRALPALFAGSGDCASLAPVLGLPLSAWTLALFGALAIAAVTAWLRGKARRPARTGPSVSPTS